MSGAVVVRARQGDGTGRQKRLTSLIEKSEITLEYSEVGNDAAIINAVVQGTSLGVSLLHDFSENL